MCVIIDVFTSLTINRECRSHDFVHLVAFIARSTDKQLTVSDDYDVLAKRMGNLLSWIICVAFFTEMSDDVS